MRMTGEQLKDWNRFKAKIHPTSLRLPPELAEELRKYAKEEGMELARMGYHQSQFPVSQL